MDGVLGLFEDRHTRGGCWPPFPAWSNAGATRGAQLSGGQQLLLIGRALTTHPTLAGFLGV